MDDIRSRGWCFTCNNYTESDELLFRGVESRYICIGKEVSASGTPHLQGYIYFDNKRSFRQMKKLHSTAHFEPQKGTNQQAMKYCKEDGDYYERGDLPKQGKRSDLDEVKEIVKTSGKMSEVVEVAKSYQSIKMAEQILKYHECKREWKPLVKWYYGSTGTGKSRSAHTEYPDAFVAMDTARWWDGYDAHSDIIIDDMRRDFCSFNMLLKYLDRYPMKVETKGGSRQFLAKNIVITCPYHPSELFKGNEDINQLLRRIDEIKKFE